MENQSLVEVDLEGNHEQFVFHHPQGTFALSPASRTLINAIAGNSSLLHGVGIDWGSGVGCLAIIAARLKGVHTVYGLEISESDIKAALENARFNHVLDKVRFMRSDSYSPYLEADRIVLNSLNKGVDFILSNPPSSEGDDGFGFRREVLRGGRRFLKKGGKVFLNISFQYGESRIEHLTKEVEGYLYKGLLHSTDWVPFDLNRAHLLYCLETYCDEEAKGGMEYTFKGFDSAEYINARTAYEYYRKTGLSPLTKWQTHLFEAAE